MTIYFNEKQSAFVTDWRRFRPEGVPLGWLLRQSEAEPWLRLHALPGSKRYAENDRERRLVLGRANWLAARILGKGHPCWQVEVVAGDQENVGYYQEAGEDFRFYFNAKQITWQYSQNDQLLTDIADDTRRALWMNKTDGKVFAPYDGGFDIFPCNQQEVDLIANKRKSWLSKHPKGL
jgi:hypothetical protein